MRTLIQKIHVEEQNSFACRRYRTPNFETSWHKHEECEVILITEGNGTAMIGDFVGEYKTGDIYFIGSDIPHSFRKRHHKMIGDAIVAHFKKDVFGEPFFLLPEIKSMFTFLNKSDAIQLANKLKKEIAVILVEMENAKGYQRINLLLQALQKMSTSANISRLTQDFSSPDNNINPAIEKIIEYSFKHYLEPLTLQQVAEHGKAEMEQEIKKISAGDLYFRVTVTQGAVCTFSYSSDGKIFIDVPETFKAVPGKWIGATIGLFCTRTQKINDAGFTDVDWFRIEK